MNRTPKCITHDRLGANKIGSFEIRTYLAQRNGFITQCSTSSLHHGYGEGHCRHDRYGRNGENVRYSNKQSWMEVSNLRLGQPGHFCVVSFQEFLKPSFIAAGWTERIKCDYSWWVTRPPWWILSPLRQVSLVSATYLTVRVDELLFPNRRPSMAK